MKGIYAWCGIKLEPDTAEEQNRSPITHGICPSCAEKAGDLVMLRIDEVDGTDTPA